MPSRSSGSSPPRTPIPKCSSRCAKPINDRAAAFRKLLVDTEPRHVDALARIRRSRLPPSLDRAETHELRGLYRQASRRRRSPHDEAIRLTLARVLVAPAFLYRAREARAGRRGQRPSPIGSWRTG